MQSTPSTDPYSVNVDDENPDAATVGNDIRTVISDFKLIVSESLGLFAIEGRLALMSAVWMVVFALIAVVAAIASWSLLAIALGYWLVGTGMTLPVALMSVAGANLLLVGLLMLRVRFLSRNFAFKSVRSQLQSSS